MSLSRQFEAPKARKHGLGRSAGHRSQRFQLGIDHKCVLRFPIEKDGEARPQLAVCDGRVGTIVQPKPWHVARHRQVHMPVVFDLPMLARAGWHMLLAEVSTPHAWPDVAAALVEVPDDAMFPEDFGLAHRIQLWTAFPMCRQAFEARGLSKDATIAVALEKKATMHLAALQRQRKNRGRSRNDRSGFDRHCYGHATQWYVVWTPGGVKFTAVKWAGDARVAGNGERSMARASASAEQGSPCAGPPSNAGNG